jgi:tRNA(His) guanylyltransferase
MPESSLSKYKNWPKHELFSESCILPETSFSIRSDGAGFKPSEIARKLKGLKTQELHELEFKQGIDLVKTPRWQRTGISVYRQRFCKQAENYMVKRWKIKENWCLLLFTEKNGAGQVHRILEVKQKKEE